MLAWLRRLIHRVRELDDDHLLRKSRELTTESNLRTVRSQHMIDRIERGYSPFEKDLFPDRDRGRNP